MGLQFYFILFIFVGVGASILEPGSQSRTHIRDLCFGVGVIT